jgi:hypothetical protein
VKVIICNVSNLIKSQYYKKIKFNNIMKKLLALATAISLIGGAASALASGDIHVSNHNAAGITNSLNVAASTGSNTSNGAQANNSTSGGNVTNSNYDNHAGNGGSTVMGGAGGSISTGSAVATADVSNEINVNRTHINATNWATNNIAVGNSNHLDLINVGGVAGMSGDNVSNGSKAKSTTTGGDVTTSGASNHAGNTGSNVAGGMGGHISTGNAGSAASVVNVINRNVTRIVK